MDIYKYIDKDLAGKNKLLTLDMKSRSVEALNSDNMVAYKARTQAKIEKSLNRLLENNSDYNRGIVQGLLYGIVIERQFRAEIKETEK